MGAKSGLNISYGPVVLLDVSPTGFQSQMWWGFASPLHVPRVGVLALGHKTLIPQMGVLNL